WTGNQLPEAIISGVAPEYDANPGLGWRIWHKRPLDVIKWWRKGEWNSFDVTYDEQNKVVHRWSVEGQSSSESVGRLSPERISRVGIEFSTPAGSSLELRNIKLKPHGL